MRFFHILLSLAVPAFVLADALSDFTNLQNIFNSTSNDLLASVIMTNGTSKGYGWNATSTTYAIALSTPYVSRSESLTGCGDEASTEPVSTGHCFGYQSLHNGRASITKQGNFKPRTLTLHCPELGSSSSFSPASAMETRPRQLLTRDTPT